MASRNSRPQNQPRQIHKPKKSAALAEFVGIMMGDGGLSDFQASIYLNDVSDVEYRDFVIARIKELFGIAPGIRHRHEKSVDVIVISRKKIVEYLHELGLPKGDKIRQGLDMPPWIKENTKFRIACVRGLVDTDGSIFTHRYLSKKKWYAYKKLSFTSASKPLLLSVCDTLAGLDLTPRIGSAQDARLDSKADMKRYFELVGTSNPKHLKRYLG